MYQKNGNKEIFEGWFVYNSINVKGRLIREDIVYEGEFADDLFHGFGTQTFSNGIKYIGQFEKGKRHGKGEIFFADGSKRQGTFIEGNEHGYSIYTSKNGKEKIYKFENNAIKESDKILKDN